MHQHNGVWVADGDTSWRDMYYLYSVQVYVPSDHAVDTNVTSDPYSIDIAINGTRSRITDLDSTETNRRRGMPSPHAGSPASTTSASMSSTSAISALAMPPCPRRIAEPMTRLPIPIPTA